MEDRYLFKAKRLDNGEWVQGYYVKGLDVFTNCEETHIIFKPNTMFYSTGETDGWYKVDPSTICQCTGLKDKNGKLIYEGDIVKCLYDSYGENGVYIGKVIYREDTCCFVDANSESTDYEWWEEEKEVIGNIFNNPELLESEEK